MSTIHQFGGDWTNEKLERVRKYLHEYTKIFNANPRAKKLHTIYVDAFAGTGYRTSKSDQPRRSLFFRRLKKTIKLFLKVVHASLWRSSHRLKNMSSLNAILSTFVNLPNFGQNLSPNVQ
jgi:three-Cys-motif partner protein